MRPRHVNAFKKCSQPGRRCQIYAVYTQKRDVTRTLEHILGIKAIRVAVLTTEVPPESREGWYERQLCTGVQAVICHPKLVQTGPDLIEFPTILFYETRYSIYALRQASRRSWRIGQCLPAKVKFLHYAEIMQETCLRQMGRKLLASLAMEGKFASEGLQAINDEDDILMAIARELVTERGIGERADSVWAALKKKQDEVFAVKSSDTKDSMPKAIAEIPTSENAIAPDPWPPIRTPVETIPQKSSRRSASESQLTLF